ncbi:MAG: beta-propeller fold lactonase family protein [Microbacterium sp.]|uniref:lactonase family protein n=1 Tax=Microbacterium sp. TaxID=51671 RepID=UPI0039E62D2C
MTSRSRVYIGNWDRWKTPEKDAFVVCELDAATGALTRLGAQFPGVSVGQVVVDARRGVLYCTDETSRHPDRFDGGGGRVLAYRIDPATGWLTELSDRPSYGSLPSHLGLVAGGSRLVVTHHTDGPPVTRTSRRADGGFSVESVYDDANTVLFPLDEDGAIGEPLDILTWHGDGGPLPRQTHPRLHSIAVAPSDAFFLVCDKGDDQVLTFRVVEGSRLEVSSVHRARPGSSPRYSAFHPSLPVVYVNHETQTVIEALAYDDAGELRSLGHVDSLPPEAVDTGATMQSDIRVSPDGRFVYQLIRELDLISAFAVDARTGALTRIQTVAAGGRDPRGCALTLDGRHLLVAARLSDDVVCWSIGVDGMLTPTDHHVPAAAAGSIAVYDLPV